MPILGVGVMTMVPVDDPRTPQEPEHAIRGHAQTIDGHEWLDVVAPVARQHHALDLQLGNDTNWRPFAHVLNSRHTLA